MQVSWFVSSRTHRSFCPRHRSQAKRLDEFLGLAGALAMIVGYESSWNSSSSSERREGPKTPSPNIVS